jgi:hypothetical protein
MTTAHRGLIGIASLLWALHGCFNPSPPAGVVCAPDGWCPSGQRCDPFIWQCVPNRGNLDAGTPWTDASWPWPPSDAFIPWPDAGLRVGIGEALISYGPVNIQIPQVLVTYVKPASLFEIPGFFVQSETSGPALFVGVDPDLGGTRLAVGDRVSFHISEMSDTSGMPMALFIDSVVIHARGQSTSDLIQDVTGASDLAFNAYLYAAELVSARFRIDGSMIGDDFGGFQSGQIATDAISEDTTMRMRVPNELQDAAGLERDCTLGVAGTPVWRYYFDTFLTAYSLAELKDVDCPAPQIIGIRADTSTEVLIELNRALDPATVASNGSQFVFQGGITATAAVVSGRFVTLTTTQQQEQVFYSMTVDQSVRDIFGKSFTPGTTTGFQGGRTRAGVRINEIKVNIVPGCDLVELRVVQPGNLSGFDLRVQNSTVLTFDSMSVERNDLVVVHFDSNDAACRRAGSANEIQAPDQQPRSTYPANFDTAFDWYTSGQGPAAGGSVMAVRDDQDRILDAVLLTDNSSQTTPPQTANAAELVRLAGEWQTRDGDVPPAGFVGAVFHDNAVAGIDADPVNVSAGFGALDGARSVQRNGNGDNDHAGDWTTAVHSFGAANPGQTPL